MDGFSTYAVIKHLNMENSLSNSPYMIILSSPFSNAAILRGILWKTSGKNGSKNGSADEF
jgi:hypothetical protein